MLDPDREKKQVEPNAVAADSFALPMKLPHLALLSLTLFRLPASAGIEFTSTTQKAVAGPEADTVEFLYKFKVTGEQKIHIKSLEVSCSCLTATLNKAEYAPGESGEVKVVFTIGSLEGELEKAVTVSTNDAKNPDIQLDCIASVEKIFDIQPVTAVWEQGSKPTTKEVKIKVLGANPINIQKFTSSRPNLQAELNTVKPGREYVLKLTPKSTEQSELAAITLETDSKIPKLAKRSVFANIPKAKAAAGK